MEDLLEVRGPPGPYRFWRVKWAGVGTDGEDLYPDTGPGDGTAAAGWVAEYLLDCEEAEGRFWRNHRDLDPREDNGDYLSLGKPRCQFCSRGYGTRNPLKNIRARGRIIFFIFPAPRLRALKIRQINSAILKVPDAALNSSHAYGTSDV